MTGVLLACLPLAWICVAIACVRVRFHPHQQGSGEVWGWHHPARCWARAAGEVALPFAALVLLAAGGSRL